MRTHISENGPGKCSATTPEGCPFAPAADHFDSMRDAEAVYEARLASTYSEHGAEVRVDETLSKREQALRDKNAELAKRLVEARAENGDHIFEDANPARAQKRLSEAIEFAKSRKNTALVGKLTSAKVLPSGSFRRSGDGKRMSVDSALEVYQSIKHIEGQREAAAQALASVMRDPSRTFSTDKYAHKDATGSYSVTLGSGTDEAAFDALPKKLRDAISTERESLNIDAARENLAPAKLRQIVTESQVADFVIGKPTDTNGPVIDTNFDGMTGDEAMKAGIERIGKMYAESREQYDGTVSELKEKQTTYTGLMKDAAARRSGNVFAPARSQWNGIVVSSRKAINQKAARELLTDDELASITVKISSPDPEKARTILSESEYARIFQAPKVSIRALPSKR